mmetsp:Transcript_39251/g.89455  ORF Transcript_39251/g.89455 Transcript_39251/m.89455 type:complete len:300 (-) Transcript_39251:135-1034(-)
MRSMMSATIPDRNSRITDEFTILNQWISSSCHCILRYTSHRDAHLTSDLTQRTSYVKTTSCFFVGLELKPRRVRLRPARRVACEEVARVVLRAFVVPLALIAVVNTRGLQLESDNEHARLLDLVDLVPAPLHVVVPDGNAEVVVDVEVGGVEVRGLRDRVPETVRHELRAVLVAEDDELSAREVVEPHVRAVLGPSEVAELVHVLLGPHLAACHLAEARDVGVALVRGGLRALASKHLAEVLRQRLLSALGLAERDIVVVKLERREIGGQRVDLDGELFAMYVLARGDTGEVEARAGTH